MDTSITKPYELYIAIKNKVINHISEHVHKLKGPHSEHVHKLKGPHSDMVRKENSRIIRLGNVRHM